MRPASTLPAVISLAMLLGSALAASDALAQQAAPGDDPADETAPADDAEPALGEAPADDAAPGGQEPFTEPPEDPPPLADPESPADLSNPPAMAPASLTVHVVTNRQEYSRLAFDIYDVSTQQLVASGVGADEGAGESAPRFDLSPGVYKIVPRGQSFFSRSDFATVRLVQGIPTEFVIVVDAATGHFRGSGILDGELPSGRKIAGLNISLNVGGTLMFNQSFNNVGTTNGEYAEFGLFGNFSLVFDRDEHFLKVDSRMALSLRDPQTQAAFATNDFFEGSALYAFNINNPWVGPYVRAGFKTRVYPGYLYLNSSTDTGQARVNRLDGTTEVYEFGTEANPDDLRIEVAEAFAPFILQQEIGANLKAVKIDLILLKLNVATRIGYGFRQGLTNGLLVVDGDEDGPVVNLFEVDDYWSHGPIIGGSATVTFARWLFASGDAAVMAPLRDRDRAGDDFFERLLLDVSATGGFRFPAFSFLHASLDYTLRLQRDGYLTSDTQFAHAIMARANLQIF